MRQAQKEIDQSLDFLGVVHAPVCVLSTEGSSASAAVFPCFNTASPCFSMEKLLPRHCSLRCFAHTQAHAVPTPKKSCDWSISFCACVIVFVSNARVNNVLLFVFQFGSKDGGGGYAQNGYDYDEIEQILRLRLRVAWFF